MKILHVCDKQINNRAYKEGYCIGERGIEQEVICTMEGDPTFMYVFDEITISTPEMYLENILESDADVILFHDRPEPSAKIVERLKKYNDKRPIVYECYDLWYYLGKKEDTFNQNEWYMLAESDLVVHMGYLNQNRSHELYDYRTPEIIVPSLTPRFLIPERAKHHIGGIVYEGGVSSHNTTDPNEVITRRFRDLHDAYWGFRNKGIYMDIYGAGHRAVDYPTMEGLFFNELLHRLTQYDWGFLGNTKELSLLQVAGPCKIWEYSMAGLPIIAMNMDDVVDQTNKGGIIKCHSVDEAVEIMQSVDREALAKESFETCRYLDDEIGVLIDACRKLV